MINYTSWPIVQSNMKAIQNNDFTEVAFTKKSGTDGTTDKLKTICPHTVVCGHKKIFQKLR